jgi:hypothetical protein
LLTNSVSTASVIVCPLRAAHAAPVQATHLYKRSDTPQQDDVGNATSRSTRTAWRPRVGSWARLGRLCLNRPGFDGGLRRGHRGRRPAADHRRGRPDRLRSEVSSLNSAAPHHYRPAAAAPPDTGSTAAAMVRPTTRCTSSPWSGCRLVSRPRTTRLVDEPKVTATSRPSAAANAASPGDPPRPRPFDEAWEHLSREGRPPIRSRGSEHCRTGGRIG